MNIYIESNSNSSILTDKNYASSHGLASALDPHEPKQVVKCIVNSGLPNSTITLSNDLLSANTISLFDINGAPLTQGSTAGTYQIKTKTSGQATFLAGSDSFCITKVSATCEDSTIYETSLVFGYADNDLTYPTLPPVTIEGLTNNIIQIPSAPLNYTFNVKISRPFPARLIITNSSRIAVTVNDILVYLGNVEQMKGSGIDVAYALLNSDKDNSISYFIATNEGTKWENAYLSPITTVSAKGKASDNPQSSTPALKEPLISLITGTKLAPADLTPSGLQITFPADQSHSATDIVDYYLFINGTDNRTGAAVSNILNFRDVSISASDIYVPQCYLSGYEAGAQIQVNYELKDSTGKSKSWSSVYTATVDKQYPAILITTVSNQQPANGSATDSLYATYFDENGSTQNGVSLNFALDAKTQASFDENAKNQPETTGSNGATPTVTITDTQTTGETVNLNVSGAAAKAQTKLIFTAAQDALSISPDPRTVPADGVSQHQTFATLMISGNPAAQQITFIIKSDSAKFVASTGVTITNGGQQATASTNAHGITPDVCFVDSRFWGEMVTLSASCDKMIAPDQYFSFSAAPASLKINPDGNTNVAADGTSQHSATATIRTTTGNHPIEGATVTFTLPQNQSATFVNPTTSPKMTSAVTGSDGTTSEVKFSDNKQTDESVTLTASTKGISGQDQAVFNFTSPAQGKIGLSPGGRNYGNPPANGKATHCLVAALTDGNGQGELNKNVQLTIPHDNSAKFIPPKNPKDYTITDGGKTATAVTGEGGLTAPISFVDTNANGETIILTASSQNKTPVNSSPLPYSESIVTGFPTALFVFQTNALNFIKTKLNDSARIYEYPYSGFMDYPASVIGNYDDWSAARLMGSDIIVTLYKNTFKIFYANDGTTDQVSSQSANSKVVSFDLVVNYDDEIGYIVYTSVEGLGFISFDIFTLLMSQPQYFAKSKSLLSAGVVSTAAILFQATGDIYTYSLCDGATCVLSSFDPSLPNTSFRISEKTACNSTFNGRVGGIYYSDHGFIWQLGKDFFTVKHPDELTPKLLKSDVSFGNGTIQERSISCDGQYIYLTHTTGNAYQCLKTDNNLQSIFDLRNITSSSNNHNKANFYESIANWLT